MTNFRISSTSKIWRTIRKSIIRWPGFACRLIMPMNMGSISRRKRGNTDETFKNWLLIHHFDSIWVFPHFFHSDNAARPRIFKLSQILKTILVRWGFTNILNMTAGKGASHRKLNIVTGWMLLDVKSKTCGSNFFRVASFRSSLLIGVGWKKNYYILLLIIQIRVSNEEAY